MLSHEDLLRERLAALEHAQWAHWTQYMLDNLTPENIERWRHQIATPYEQLSEREKNSDREWALRVIQVLFDTKKGSSTCRRPVMLDGIRRGR